ncbi:unnamed protein product [Arabis nemorensis]|uniref:Uncharacterized protein n=1 Tax=Arabis nemorensis TaxID=586526 RepID=A0A565BT51_9BRAS|nr:unnamed protein product [Arabis nemorensis]
MMRLQGYGSDGHLVQFDTLKEIIASSKSNSMFIPHSPGILKDIASHIRDGLLQGNSAL